MLLLIPPPPIKGEKRIDGRSVCRFRMVFALYFKGDGYSGMNEGTFLGVFKCFGK